jgi:carbamoyl-phosphate synthase large subunit
MDFPLFIKPRFGSGSKESYKINDRKELSFYCGNLYNGIIQEYINGVEYSIDTLGDKDGNMICCVPRIRTKISNGLSIMGKTFYNEKMIEYCKKLVNGLKLFGPGCIQCIETEDGDLKFLEINNRFGGGAILSIKACSEFIPSLISLINGERIERKTPYAFKENLMMFRNYTEIFKDFSERHV